GINVEVFDPTVDVRNVGYKEVLKDARGWTVENVDSSAVPVPVITSQPRNANVVAGKNAQFRFRAKGRRLYYQWLKNDVPILGATSSKLTIRKVTLADNGARIWAIVTNGRRTVATWHARLTVRAG